MQNVASTRNTILRMELLLKVYGGTWPDCRHYIIRQQIPEAMSQP